MRITETIRVNHEFRHYRKAQTLIQTIDARMHWYIKHMREKVMPLHMSRAAEITMHLDREISNENLVWEINTSLSRRPILTLPVKQITQYIFYDLPEPTAAQLTNLEQSLTELMTMRARTLAAQQHKFLLMCEIAYRAHQNWYMIFNTLTVRPGEYYNVFNRDNRRFRDYIRWVDRGAAIATHGSIRGAQNKDYHSHFACVEEGGTNGRLHIHSLHFMQELERGCNDPNKGLIKPTNRTLDTLRKHWQWGRSEPIIVRYSPTDAYGKAGYRWPIDYKTDAPMQIKSPLALATYMAKYITKGYNSCQRQKLLWRVRKSQKLGTQILNELVAPLSTSTLIILTVADNLKSKLNNQMIPQNQLRLASLRQLQNRLSTQPYNGSNLTTLAKLSTPRLSPLHSLRASTQTIHKNNQQNTQYLSTLNITNEDIYNAWHELQTQVKHANDKYFPTNARVYGTTSTRDHIYNT